MGNKVSLREFGRQIGVSDTAVRKAIAAGKISKAVDYTNPKRPLIDPEIAVVEWGKNYDPSYHRTEKVTDGMGASKPTSVGTDSENEPKTSGGKSLASIKLQTAEVRLHKEALELKTKRGELVSKEKVYRSLFAAGQEIRTSLQALPDRVIDDILACKTRNEAHGVLYNAIADALEALSEIGNREIS